MVVQFDAEKVAYDFMTDCVRFLALDGAKLVRCAISREALETLAKMNASSGESESLIAAYRANTDEIHAVARAKFADKAFEASGFILIGPQDLI